VSPIKQEIAQCFTYSEADEKPSLPQLNTEYHYPQITEYHYPKVLLIFIKETPFSSSLLNRKMMRSSR
jgi:hypothetical protein